MDSTGPNDDYITFHIRAAGDWTKTLHKRCEKTMTPDASEPSKPEVNGKEEGGPVPALCILSPDMRVYVDGPFGAPAQDHSHFDCLLLVVKPRKTHAIICLIQHIDCFVSLSKHKI